MGLGSRRTIEDAKWVEGLRVSQGEVVESEELGPAQFRWGSCRGGGGARGTECIVTRVKDHNGRLIISSGGDITLKGDSC